MFEYITLEERLNENKDVSNAINSKYLTGEVDPENGLPIYNNPKPTKKEIKELVKDGNFTVQFVDCIGDFDCSDCKLIELTGAPRKIRGDFE